jgi:hypothetical protein
MNLDEIIRQEKNKQLDVEKKIKSIWSNIESHLHGLFTSSRFDLNAECKQIMQELSQKGLTEVNERYIKIFILTSFIEFRDISASPGSRRFHQQQPDQQRKQEVIFFWDADEKNGFLSNWFMASFVDPKSNIYFTTSEKFYMAAKAVLANDVTNFMNIMVSDEPKTVKMFGRQVASRDPKAFESLWDEHKVAVMEVACYLKFSQNKDLKDRLLLTGSALLVEASPYDKFWGIGTLEKDAKSISPDKFSGSNHLGHVLMKVRDQIRDNITPIHTDEALYISDFVKTLPHQFLESLPRHNENEQQQQQPKEEDLKILEAYLTNYRIDIMNTNLDFDKIAKDIEEEMYNQAIGIERSKNNKDFNIPFEAREDMRQRLARGLLFYQAQQYTIRGRQQPPPRRRPQEPQGIYERALEMGFEEALVRRALSQANGDEQEALEILINGTLEEERPQEPQGIYERALEMGFDQALVRRALSQANGDEQVALEILINGTLEEERPQEPIYSMGFDPALVQQALSQTKGNHEQAIADLLAGRVELLDEKLMASIDAMHTITVAGNGNCLFLSLIGSLQNLFRHLNNPVDFNKVPHNQSAMRKKIVDFERIHHDELIFYNSVSITVNPNPPYLQALEMKDPVKLHGREHNYQTLQQYFDLMETDGAYATDVEIMTAARIFGVTIYVQIKRGYVKFARYYSSNPEAQDSRRAIYIVKADTMGHYDWKDPYSKRGGKHKQGKKIKMNRSINKCKKLSKRETRYKKIIYKYSSPTQAQKMATKYLGKTAKLYPANNPVKKYRICDPVSKKWVNFGQLGYEDYTRHKDKTRRHNYLTRTANMRGNWKKNKYSANNLSRRVLWG